MPYSAQELDPHNPVDKKNLAEGIVRRISLQPACPMPPDTPFIGAGVYLLYYVGSADLYAPVAALNKDEKFALPIYVGKADPKGTRKGARLDPKPGPAIFQRLGQHADRIRATQNLKIKDFYFRFVVLDYVWIRLGEAGLIDHYRPLWNAMLDGFGSKIPGANRAKQKRSAWDTIHPGAGWPELTSAGKHSIDTLLTNVKTFLVK